MSKILSSDSLVIKLSTTSLEIVDLRLHACSAFSHPSFDDQVVHKVVFLECMETKDMVEGGHEGRHLVLVRFYESS